MTELDYLGTELEAFKSAFNWKKYWAARIRPYVRGRVLEVGAGIGGSTTALQVAQRTRWTCLEPDPTLAGQLTQLFNDGGLSGDYDVVTGTLADLPENAAYETILYIDVLEHIEYDGAELTQAATRLETGGHLIVLSPAHQFLYSNFDKAIGHFRRYSRKSLLDVAPVEVTLVQVFYLDSVGLLASLANRLLLHSESPSQSQISFWDKVMIPCSRVVDPLILRKLGKTIVAVWRKNE